MPQKQPPAFLPFDASGALVRVCEREADLNGFADWLGAEPLEGDPADKGAYAEAVLGSFFAPWLRQAVGLARIEQVEVRNDDENDFWAQENAEAAAEVGRARGLLGKLLAGLGSERFRAAWLRSGAPQAAAEAAEADLNADGQLQSEFVSILAAESPEALGVALRERLKDPALRRLIRSYGARDGLEDGYELYGDFAPWIEFVARHLGPSGRAQALARFLAYVDSGWAAADRASGELGADPAKSLDDRIWKLLIPLRLKWPANGGKLDWLDKLAGLRWVKEDSIPYYPESGMAEEGFVHAAIVGPDGKTLAVSWASGDSTFENEGDGYFPRPIFLRGLANSLRNTRFLSSLGAKAGTRISASFLFPVAVGGDEGTGKSIRSLFGAAPDRAEAEALSELVFARGLMQNTHPEQLRLACGIEAVPVGGSLDGWNEKMRAVLALPEDKRAEAVMAALCQTTERTLAFVEKAGVVNLTRRTLEAAQLRFLNFLALVVLVGLDLRGKRESSEAADPAFAAARAALFEREAGLEALAKAVGEENMVYHTVGRDSLIFRFYLDELREVKTNLRKKPRKGKAAN